MSFVLFRNDIPEPSKYALKDQVVQIIGRGSLRDCNDSRISREHASIATQGETLILRALHQKSCFYRKSFSDVMNELSYGESVELFHGDSFGLLPETNWYELVYIKKEDAEDDKNNAEVQNKNMQPNPKNDEQSALTKRPHTPNQDPGAKKIKTEPESPMTEGTVPTSTIAVGEIPNNTKENCKVESSQALTQDEGVARSNNQGEPMDVTETDNDITNESLGDVNLASDKNKKVDIATDSSDNDVNISKDSTSDSLGLNNPTDSDTDAHSAADKIAVSKKVVKKELESLTKESAAPLGTSSVTNSDTEMPSSGEEMVVKKEPGASGANDVKTESQSPDAAQPGTSKDQPGQAGASNDGAAPAPAQPHVRPRERCLYGANCYRKNPQHKVQFGHPGDADYEACERAVCPYGAQCYRTEPRHWLAHTHPDGTLPPQRPRNAKKRQKVTPPSESEDSEDSPPEHLVVQGKRKRKAVKRDVITYSDDDDEPVDPYATDESDDWEPT